MKEVLNILNKENYVKESLGLNLFFLRILKEHALFLGTSFPPKNVDFITEAKQFNLYYNNLLKRALKLATGIISIEDYMVTNFTLEAEKVTMQLLGNPIDTDATINEINLSTEPVVKSWNDSLETEVSALNKEILTVTENFISFKTKIIDAVNSCKLFSYNYPDMLDHLREEAIHYTDLLNRLDYRLDNKKIADALKEELFWNHIMAEHARYFRGQLDPDETKLIKLANYFSNQYDELTSKSLIFVNNDQLIDALTSESLKLTKELEEYKIQNLEGNLECRIKSVMPPLLIDHVLREANFYLHLLTGIL
jgi:hypothetical protein